LAQGCPHGLGYQPGQAPPGAVRQPRDHIASCLRF
jgi:hypothetical protein